MLNTAIALGIGKSAISSANIAPRLSECMKSLHEVGCLTHLDDDTSKKGGISHRKSSGMRTEPKTEQLGITTVLKVLKVLTAGARHLRH